MGGWSPDNICEHLNMRDFMDAMRASGLTGGRPSLLYATNGQSFASELGNYLSTYTAVCIRGCD